jgi:DNA-binding beta-propeller fold protein YncE
LKLEHTISLPGVKGRFDHFAIDTNTHRLFVAALGNDTLEILDVAAGKRLHTIRGLHKPTGVVFLPGENQFGVANGNDGTFRVYEGNAYKEIARIDGLDDADNVRRDGRTGLIYAGYSNGALAVVDPRSWKATSKVKLPAHPESFQLEWEGKRIFVNLPDAKKSELWIVRHTSSWPSGPWKSSTPIFRWRSMKTIIVSSSAAGNQHAWPFSTRRTVASSRTSRFPATLTTCFTIQS